MRWHRGPLESGDAGENGVFGSYRYLTGNPCTEYEGYREYVIATLDNLQWLDGKEIEKSERILAKQVWLLFNPILHI